MVLNDNMIDMLLQFKDYVLPYPNHAWHFFVFSVFMKSSSLHNQIIIWKHILLKSEDTFTKLNNL